MRILLLYGTTEGQTRHICDSVASQLTGYGDTVAMHDAASLPAGFSCGAFDAIIIAASVHVGAYQASVTHFVRTHVEVLNRKPTAFLSVSLAAASSDPEEQKAVADCVRRFLETTGWKPAQVIHAAGAFRFARYDFFKGWGMKLIAWEKGIKVPAGEDLELTNWAELRERIDAARAGFAKAA